MERGRGRRAASAVVASDRCYFSLGAEERPVPGGAILHLDGLGAVGAATVTWVDRPEEIVDPRAWVADVAAQVVDLGGAEVRIYGAGLVGPLADQLLASGFTAREELIFVGTVPPPPLAIELVPLSAPGAGAARRALYAGLEVGPDGHRADVDGWCAAEDRRAATGALHLFVACSAGVPVGAVGMLDAGPVVRMKNLLVGAAHRRRGVGQAIVGAVAAHPLAAGRPVAMIALAGEPGEAMYRKLGLPVVGTLVEWSRAVGTR